MSVGISQGTEDDEYTSEASFSKSKRRIPIDTETIRLYLTSVYVVYLFDALVLVCATVFLL